MSNGHVQTRRHVETGGCLTRQETTSGDTWEACKSLESGASFRTPGDTSDAWAAVTAASRGVLPTRADTSDAWAAVTAASRGRLADTCRHVRRVGDSNGRESGGVRRTPGDTSDTSVGKLLEPPPTPTPTPLLGGLHPEEEGVSCRTPADTSDARVPPISSPCVALQARNRVMDRALTPMPPPRSSQSRRRWPPDDVREAAQSIGVELDIGKYAPAKEKAHDGISMWAADLPRFPLR